MIYATERNDKRRMKGEVSLVSPCPKSVRRSCRLMKFATSVWTVFYMDILGKCEMRIVWPRGAKFGVSLPHHLVHLVICLHGLTDRLCCFLLDF